MWYNVIPNQNCFATAIYETSDLFVKSIVEYVHIYTHENSKKCKNVQKNYYKYITSN